MKQLYASVLALILAAPCALAVDSVESTVDYLYEAMPLPDKAMYDRSFFERNVELSYKARAEMPWGSVVPDREFRHFVVPVRVNNENLDMSREVFYNELKARVEGLSMKDAILEINHWCHEKVTYRPSDGRTSSPLSSVSQAIGRCGEESTFAVAALRAMCIPARQIYTPRWAHTDDNHAWVEAWADGQWYFLGACEPEPVLDMAWFNAPASRGMMMYTNVFGRYDGPEEQVEQTDYYTTINVTSKYAPTSNVNVRVVDRDGNSVPGAKVKFCLYNYAEYFPLAQKTADKDGCASLNVGHGDLVVWATDGDNFGFAKGSAKEMLTVILDKDVHYKGTVEFDLVPPPLSGSLPKPDAAAVEHNERRKAIEDSIRMAYVATFAGDVEAEKLAGETGVDSRALSKILKESRGNHGVLTAFLRSVPDSLRCRAMALLGAVSEKDRRDVAYDVLVDNLYYSTACDSLDDVTVNYILNPRVENEGLVPYKRYFTENLAAEQRQAYASDPSLWLSRLREHVEIVPDSNPKKLRMSPVSVWTCGKADALSASICFVAGARSCGIASRIDPVTGKAQYMSPSDGSWVDVAVVDSAEPTVAPVGELSASSIVTGAVKEPKYYFHYSINKIENGVPRQLEYDEGISVEDFIATKPQLDCGQYMLVTGQRLASGTVLARNEFFVVEPGGCTQVPFVFRHHDSAPQVIGSLNAEHIYTNVDEGADRSLLSSTGRGYYTLALIRPGHEPSAHVLNDICARAAEFEKLGRPLVLLFADAGQAARFDASLHGALPAGTIIGIDKDGAVANELAQSLLIDTDDAPVVVIADTFNRVVFASTGYTVGIGDRLVSVLSAVGE